VPNQDSFLYEPLDWGRAVVAAVADGHGSRKCFRSDRGARFAVQTAVEHLRTYAIAGPLDDGRASALRHDAAVELPQRIVRGWQQRVDTDLEASPLSADDLAGLLDADRAALDADPRGAYGTTLVAVLLLPDYGIYLQLGDGDVLVVSDAADEATRPLPPDPRSFANETASLSSPGTSSPVRRPGGGSGAWADFRVRVLPTAADTPALVLLTTDGYPNAFVDDAAFRKAATDILALGRTEGWALVREQFRGWLVEASRSGSGDDVTVALLIREGAPEASDPHARPVEGGEGRAACPASPPESSSPVTDVPPAPEKA
jgi:hypothetical protein